MSKIANAACALLMTALVFGCTQNIPNTDVKDTEVNRDVINFMEDYRKAVEKRDVEALMHMAHPQYLDDNGSPSGTDDIDYERLQHELQGWNARVIDVRYDIKYTSIREERGKIFVEFRYAASYRLKQADGSEKWSRRIGDQRMILERSPTNQKFLVLSGM